MNTLDYNPPMTKKEKIICRRINRINKRNGSSERICKSRSLSLFQNVGRFYIKDSHRNLIYFHNVDPEEWLQDVIRDEKDIPVMKKLGLTIQGLKLL
jgi:hypothetical protein